MTPTAIDFDQILSWVVSLTTSLSSMFSSLSTLWVLYVPLALGVFGYIFVKIRGLTWNKSGRRRKG